MLTKFGVVVDGGNGNKTENDAGVIPPPANLSIYWSVPMSVAVIP